MEGSSGEQEGPRVPASRGREAGTRAGNVHIPAHSGQRRSDGALMCQKCLDVCAGCHWNANQV